MLSSCNKNPTSQIAAGGLSKQHGRDELVLYKCGAIGLLHMRHTVDEGPLFCSQMVDVLRLARNLASGNVSDDPGLLVLTMTSPPMTGCGAGACSTSSTAQMTLSIGSVTTQTSRQSRSLAQMVQDGTSTSVVASMANAYRCAPVRSFPKTLGSDRPIVLLADRHADVVRFGCCVMGHARTCHLQQMHCNMQELSGLMLSQDPAMLCACSAWCSVL